MKSKKKPVYKVVKKDRTSIGLSNRSPFCLKYIKSFEVKKVDGTLGIFCFKRKKDAAEFIVMFKDQYKIIRVFPFGKPSFPKKISPAFNSKWINGFYKYFQTDSDYCPNWLVGSLCRTPPKGTVCYPSVLVVD